MVRKTIDRLENLIEGDVFRAYEGLYILVGNKTVKFLYGENKLETMYPDTQVKILGNWIPGYWKQPKNSNDYIVV
jgi:hypothetical protein